MNPKQKSSQRQQRSNNKSRSHYDYNKPISKCVVCYVLSGWHCYDCGHDFCSDHFQKHKENNECIGISK